MKDIDIMGIILQNLVSGKSSYIYPDIRLQKYEGRGWGGQFNQSCLRKPASEDLSDVSLCSSHWQMVEFVQSSLADGWHIPSRVGGWDLFSGYLFSGDNPLIIPFPQDQLFPPVVLLVSSNLPNY